jgi:hypothetical protein
MKTELAQRWLAAFYAAVEDGFFRSWKMSSNTGRFERFARS